LHGMLQQVHFFFKDSILILDTYEASWWEVELVGWYTKCTPYLSAVSADF
jgi:hypothetical protein